jgi:hypothetical protein
MQNAQSDNDHADQERFSDLARDAQNNATNSCRILPVRPFTERDPTDAMLPSIKRHAHLSALINHPAPRRSLNTTRINHMPSKLR